LNVITLHIWSPDQLHLKYVSCFTLSASELELLFLIVTWIQLLYCYRGAFSIISQYCKPVFTLHQSSITQLVSVLTYTNEMWEILTNTVASYTL